MSDSKIDRLRELAEKKVNRSADEKELERELSESTDTSGLRSLAYEFTPHPEVSVPIYRRLIELQPDDPDLAAELGFIFWLSGEDDLAREQVVIGSRLEPDNVQTLLLRAALEPERDEKHRLYNRVLKRDPENSVALANLEDLDSS
jgi:hypothetical protein